MSIADLEQAAEKVKQRLPAQALSGREAHTRLNGSAAVSQVDLAASLTGYPYSTRCSATGRRRQGCRPSLLAAHLHVVWPVGVEGLRYLACWSIMPAKQAPQGEAAMGDPQRLTDTEQLEILALLEAASTEDSAMRAARALADLMRHLHTLGRRIAVELPDQDHDGKPAGR